MILKAFTLPAIVLAAVSIFGFKVSDVSRPVTSKAPSASVRVSPRVSPKVTMIPTVNKLPLVSSVPAVRKVAPMVTSKPQVRTQVTPKPRSAIQGTATPTPPPGWEVPAGGYNYLP